MRLERPLPSEDLEHVRLGAASLWPELKGSRILLTGATGFFGRWLLESLLVTEERHGLGVRITALSRDPEAFLKGAPHLANSGFQWLRGSVTTLELDSLGTEKFDMVIHLATEANMEAIRTNPEAAIAVITDGTRRVLGLASKAGARRFLFTSTGAVYGRQPPELERIPESYSGKPDPSDLKSIYAVSGEAKRQAELLCLGRARDEGLGAVIARCFTFAGPGLPMDGKFAFGNFLRDALEGVPIHLTGDGTPVRSYLYAADLALWLWTLLLRGAPGRVYNVGSEEPINLRTLAESMAAELASPGVEVLRQPKPGTALDRYVPSTARARDELGLRENFNLREIIRRTAAWHRTPVKR